MSNGQVAPEVYIRPLERSDIPRLCDIFAACFAGDPLERAIRPTSHEHPWVQRSLSTLTTRRRMYSPTVLQLVAIDSTTNLLVGYAGWELRGNPAEPCEFKSFLAQPWTTRLFGAVENFLVGLEGMYFDNVIDHITDRSVASALRSHPLPPYTGLDDYLFLRGLFVAPEFQRKGIGKTLVQWGLDVAERDRLPIGLVSSQAAEYMYQKLGFKVLGHELVVSSNNALMLFEPESIRGEVLEQGWKVRSQARFPKVKVDIPTAKDADAFS